MGLVDLTTDLKSLRYGKDRIGGGKGSNQPYVTKDIPGNPNLPFSDPSNTGLNGIGESGGPDFLLRGGLLTPGKIANDTSRLTQMFFDFKSPNGLLFTAKQNVLSRTAVATNGEDKALNNGVYLPTSTILGAAGNPIGLHLNKQGINPFAGIYTGDNDFLSAISNFDPLGNPTYKSIVKLKSTSRLEGFLDDKIKRKKKSNEGNDLFSYPGGPGSILGVGKTTISLSKDRTGINNPEVEKFKFANIDWFNSKYTEGNQTEIQKSNLLKDPIIRFEITNDKDKRVGASLKYVSEFKNTFRPITSLFQFDGKAKPPPSVYKLSEKGPNGYTLKTNTEITGGNTLTQEQLVEKKSAAKTGIYNTENFITNIPGALPYLKTNYSGSNRIEQRVNLGNPGKKTKNDREVLDKINATRIYKTDANNPIVTDTNDLVKFRIGVIDNNNPKFKTNIHFRAFIDSMSDSYSADWQTQKFMGRGENFYRYNGFDRTVSLSWTVVAQSKAELMPMYQKLNYLASVCTPDYSDLGYMRGNLIKLTIGGYLYEQVGIMKSITYSIPENSPWEIALPYGSEEGGTPLKVLSDSTVKEVPHMIKVTGFQFIPIHDFVPSVQKNSFIGYDENPYNTALAKAGEEIESLTNLDVGGSEYLQNWQAENARKNIKENKGTYELKRYGTQKYIALSNGLNNNYKVKNG